MKKNVSQNISHGGIMKKSVIKIAWVGSLAGSLLVTQPFTMNANAASDHWNQGQAELQKALAPGDSASAYRKAIEDMGYKVTSVNYNDKDYVEYELVKDDQTWEVQIDVNEKTGKATNVDVAMNAWKTDATERALGQKTAKSDPDVRRNPYSDRARVTTSQLIKELEALPVGHEKQYYKDQLKTHGYEITKINTDDTDELTLEAVKKAHSVDLTVSFDENTGKSTSVDASTLWMESQSTAETREAQKH